MVTELEKQLKQKEQELEQYKKSKQASYEAMQKKCNELELENRKLKAENETYKKMFEDEDIQLALNEVRTGERHLWFNKAEKLEQALNGMREVAKSVTNDGSECIDCDGLNCADCLDDKMQQILNKISEVIKDE